MVVDSTLLIKSKICEWLSKVRLEHRLPLEPKFLTSELKNLSSACHQSVIKLWNLPKFHEISTSAHFYVLCFIKYLGHWGSPFLGPPNFWSLERETGLKPATSALARQRSINWATPAFSKKYRKNRGQTLSMDQRLVNLVLRAIFCLKLSILSQINLVLTRYLGEPDSSFFKKYPIVNPWTVRQIFNIKMNWFAEVSWVDLFISWSQLSTIFFLLIKGLILGGGLRDSLSRDSLACSD